MAAVLEAPVEQQDKPVSEAQRRAREALKAYEFKPGCKAGPGRPTKAAEFSASEILKAKEAKIAQHYVQRAVKSDTVLIDAMSKLLPKHQIVADGAAPIMIIFGTPPPTLISAPSALLLPSAPSA